MNSKKVDSPNGGNLKKKKTFKKQYRESTESLDRSSASPGSKMG